MFAGWYWLWRANGEIPFVPDRTEPDNFSAFVLHPNCLFLGFSCLKETLKAREPTMTRVPGSFPEIRENLGLATDGLGA
jgi:hypothetical protein